MIYMERENIFAKVSTELLQEVLYVQYSSIILSMKPEENEKSVHL